MKPKKVRIYMADGEMRENGALDMPYNSDMIDWQLRLISYEKRWFEARGYEVMVIHADQLDTSYYGIDDEIEQELYDSVPENIEKELPDQFVLNAFNTMMRGCQRCALIWTKKTMNEPKDCPRCGSRVWFKPRTGHEPGPKPRKR